MRYGTGFLYSEKNYKIPKKINLKIGLSGNIGSGKSTVLKEFEKLGVPVFDADASAKFFLDDIKVLYYLTQRYGIKVVSGFNVDKKALANIIFNDKEELEKFETIIHPLVRKDFIEWCNDQDYPYVMMESAILFESGFDSMMDKNITVVCDEKIAIERVIKRDNITEDKVRKRLLNQLSQVDKAFLSDYIIMNNNQDLTKQVNKIHNELKHV